MSIYSSIAKEKALSSLFKNDDLSKGKVFFDAIKSEFNKARGNGNSNPLKLKEGEDKPGFFSHKNESVFSEKGLTKIGANAAITLTSLGSSLTVQLLSSYVIDKAVTQQMKIRNEALSFIGNTASSAYNKLFGNSDEVADTSSLKKKMNPQKPTPYS